MSRTAHKKSRYGCKECKKRHKRCDETRPSCENCSTTNRRCSFLGLLHIPTPPASLTVSVSSYSAPTPSTLHGGDLQAPQPHVFTMTQLQLLYHAEVDMLGILGIEESRAIATWRTIFKCALQAPYLMDQLLALSAAHLSHLHIDERIRYQNEATTLQTRSLAVFKTVDPPTRSSPDCLAVFLYSSTLSIHVLYEALLCRDDFNTFLDQFTAYLSVHRGVRAVLPPGSFADMQSQLQELLGGCDFHSTLQSTTSDNAGHECDPLLKLIDAADMSHASSIACHQAAKSLQWTYTMCSEARSLNDYVNFVMAWPVVISSAFVDLIKQRRAEAMIILAYFAVLLDNSREYWVFGDGGRHLIQSITAHLGAFWEEWLVWPNEVLKRNKPMDA